MAGQDEAWIGLENPEARDPSGVGKTSDTEQRLGGPVPGDSSVAPGNPERALTSSLMTHERAKLPPAGGQGDSALCPFLYCLK